MGVRWLTGLAMVFAFALGPGAQARVIQGGPDAMNDFRTLEQVLRDAKDRRAPVQLVFVHGMRATGPGTSDVFRKNLAERLHLSCDRATSPPPLMIGGWPKHAAINGRRIWPEESDWKDNQPFVLRHVCEGDSGTLVVDEVNWWPLLFPIKCAFLVGPESQLSGSQRQLARCRHWIRAERYEDAKPQSLGGSVINQIAKQELFNWGFADAVIAVGPMRDLLNTTMEEAFRVADSKAFAETIVVSESLGSFVVLDALAVGKPNVTATLERTGNLYFFANQFALLSLARIEDLDGATKDATGQPSSPLRALERLAQARSDRADVERAAGREPKVTPVQIVAFSDPSDLLTWCVPPLGKTKVANVFVRNQLTFLGLFADPASAHTGHSDNAEVLKIVIGGTKDTSSGRDPRCYTKPN